MGVLIDRDVSRDSPDLTQDEGWQLRLQEEVAGLCSGDLEEGETESGHIIHRFLDWAKFVTTITWPLTGCSPLNWSRYLSFSLLDTTHGSLAGFILWLPMDTAEKNKFTLHLEKSISASAVAR